MSRERQEPGSFTELVRAAGSANLDREQPVQAWPQPIGDGRWIDDGGVRWHLRGRGGDSGAPALRRLLKRPDLRVLHAYGVHPLEVSGPDRAALLERVKRYLAGEAPPHSAFRWAEFRNHDGQVMLVIEEAC